MGSPEQNAAYLQLSRIRGTLPSPPDASQSVGLLEIPSEDGSKMTLQIWEEANWLRI